MAGKVTIDQIAVMRTHELRNTLIQAFGLNREDVRTRSNNL